MLGNLSSRSRGFDPLPAKVSQPEAGLAWVMATSLMKRRQQVLKPRGSLDRKVAQKPLLLRQQGQHRRDRQWRGNVGSAGNLDRGKGTGWIAWKPLRCPTRVHTMVHRQGGSPVEQRRGRPLSS